MSGPSRAKRMEEARIERVSKKLRTCPPASSPFRPFAPFFFNGNFAEGYVYDHETWQRICELYDIANGTDPSRAQLVIKTVEELEKDPHYIPIYGFLSYANGPTLKQTMGLRGDAHLHPLGSN